MNVEPPETLVLIESILYKSNGFAIYTPTISLVDASIARKIHCLLSLLPTNDHISSH